MKVKNKLTVTRVQYLAILVFAESFLVPLQAHLATGMFPDRVEFIGYMVTGGVQAVTLLLALLKKEETEPVEIKEGGNPSVVALHRVVCKVRNYLRTGFYSVR